MASYFWVGGAGTWDGSTTTNWATSSGGTGSAGVPTSTDTVTFDSNSGLTTNQTVTVAGTSVCGGCSISGTTGKEVTWQLSGNPTWSAGTYTFQGTTQIPIWILSNSTAAVTRTLTINGTHSGHQYVHFTDIALTGTAGTLSGTGIGDGLGNSGITFDTPATQTWQGTSGGNWSDVTKWTSRIPLPQDPVLLPNAFSASQTITLDM